MYHYRAKLIRVIDGDTVVLEIDVGFHMTTKQHIRLLGIDAPEKRGESKEAGMLAKEHLIKLLEGIDILIVYTEKSDSFGRWLGTLYTEGHDINQAMIDDGHAVKYVK